MNNELPKINIIHAPSSRNLMVMELGSRINNGMQEEPGESTQTFDEFEKGGVNSEHKIEKQWANQEGIPLFENSIGDGVEPHRLIGIR